MRSRIESRARDTVFQQKDDRLNKSPTFGFSAFLKLVSLNDRPQKAAVRDRFRPSNGKGYDYHRSLRIALQKISDGTHRPTEVLSSLSTITKMAERHSAKRGVVRFLRWQKEYTGHRSYCEPILIESPSGLFRVRFEADCVVEIEGRRTAIHVWNTKSPKLSRNLVLTALTIVQQQWPKDRDTADDFAVLSLQDMKFYRWSDDPKAYRNAADAMMRHLERLCIAAISEDGGTTKIAPHKGPHPDA